MRTENKFNINNKFYTMNMNREKTIYSDYLIALVESFMGEGDGKSIKKTKAAMQKWFCDVAKASGQWGTRSFNRLTIFNQLAAVGAAIEDDFVTFTSKRGCEGGCILKIHDPKKLIDNLRGLTDEEIAEYVKEFKEGRKKANKEQHKEKQHSDLDFEALKKQLEPEKKTSEEEKKSPAQEVKSPVVRVKKNQSSTIVGFTRRTYSPSILREGYYIGILAKAYPSFTIDRIVKILSNNYLLVFTDSFKTSQELKTRICTGKLSTIFSITSDGRIGYKPQGQGIVSFNDLKTKYYASNDIQKASIIVYDPYSTWRESVNTSYINDISEVRSFTSAPQVCGCTAHWGCTPSALYRAWKEFHLPLQGKYHYLDEVKVPLPFIKEEILPDFDNWARFFADEEITPEIETFRNTILLYWADMRA